MPSVSGVRHKVDAIGRTVESMHRERRGKFVSDFVDAWTRVMTLDRLDVM
jgi:catalase (peroxidase I)